ncbi:kinase-like domain-containing protein [Obelidium mucronatum]|nr:kinase-like domain-containing protein [Obelidium mucronatum]
MSNQPQQSSTPPLVWFLLLDSATGNPYKNTFASCVVRSSLVVPVVDLFRDAVHLKNSSILTGIASSQLRVYKNKLSFDKRNTSVVVDTEQEEPLEEDALIDGFGTSKKDALVVAVQASEASNPPCIDIFDKLKQLGVEFSIRDVNYLFDNDMPRYSLLKSPQLTPEEARKLLTFAASKIKSATKRLIRQQHSFFLEACLNVGQGQTKSSLYYAFSESGVALVAKVYTAENKKSFLREVETNRALEYHKNLVKFIQSFSIQDNTRHVIIMPHFPRSVADWLSQGSELPLAAVKIIAQSCFDALCHLHTKMYCFVDLKPSNIMLGNSEPSYATLVDYGATVRIGSPVIEFTASYCLDSDTTTATEHLDWVCLGTTLAQIAGFDVFNFAKAADLVDEVCRSIITNDDLKNLIVSCLQSPSLSKIEDAISQL